MAKDSHNTSSMIFQRLDQTAKYPYSLSEYGRRYAWSWVERLLIRPSPARAHRWRRFWLIRFGARLGIASTIRPDTTVLHPWLVTMGDYCMIGDRVNVYNLGPITIGHHTVISQDTYLCGGTHEYTQLNFPLVRTPITIGSGVWVCAGSFVGPGVTIGDNSIVGARSVVTRDVPPGVIVAGNPARVIKDRPTPETTLDVKDT